MNKQRDKAESRSEKAGTLAEGLSRDKRQVKYIRKGRKNAKKRLSRARRRVDKAVVNDE